MFFKFVLAVLFLCITTFATDDYEANIQMLNYVGSLSERIKDVRKNRFELQNIRDEIYNDVKTTGVNPRTKGILLDYQELIKDYTLIARQRDRIQLIIDNKKAEALSKAIPDPQYLISTALSKPNPYLLIANIGTMIASSVISYKTSMASADMEELKMNWELEDKDYITFEKQSRDAWEYRVDVSNKYNIENSLNEKTIQKFFLIEKDEMIERRLKELENPEISELYVGAHYQPYYLALAEAYYQSENWKNCVDAYKEYEKNSVKIFIKDHAAAKMLPKVIEAAQKFMSNADYISFLLNYNQKLIKETTDEEWELRYFAALNYLNLAGLDVTNRKMHLKEAFNVFANNISKLSIRQDTLLAKYILPVDENIPNDLTDEKKKAHKEMIKLEKRERKAKTLPLDKALYANMEMAYAIAKQNKELSTEWEKIIPIVKKSIENAQLRKKYGLNVPNYNRSTFDGKYLQIPIYFVNSDLSISMIVEKMNGQRYTLPNVSFEIKNIDRPDDDDLVLDQKNEMFIGQLDNFNVKLKLSLKSFKIDFDEIKSITFVLKSYNESILISLVNVDDDFVVNKMQ